MTPEKTYPSSLQSWMVWSFGALFFLLGFFHQVAPAVLNRELSQEFGLTAASLGGLTGLYFYSYVAMQIPTGLLADRFGPRLLLTSGLLLTAAGSVVFALAPNLFWAGLGRFMIGGSVAVAFVSTLKLSSHWFAPQRFTFSTGLLLLAGMTGAVFAGVPLHAMTLTFGWRNVTAFSAVLAILMGGMVYWIVRDDPCEKGLRGYVYKIKAGTPDESIWFSLRKVISYRNTRILAFAPGGLVGAVLTFSGLWGVPFLTDVYGFGSAQAATLCSVVLLSWALSGLVFSLVSERILRRRRPYYLGCAISLGAWSVVFLISNLSVEWLVLLLCLAGFFSGGMILGFAQAKETVPAQLAGTVSGVVNMGVMSGPMLLQPLVGMLLDLGWMGEQNEAGIRVYDFATYRIAFSPMLGWLVLSTLFLFFTRESHCRQQVFDEVSSEHSYRSQQLIK